MPDSEAIIATDNEVTTGLDQPILLDVYPILADLDQFYNNALTTDNPALTILNKGKEILARMRVEGLMLCKLLHRLKGDWDKMGIREGFETSVFGIMGLHSITIDRYISVWDMFAKNLVPEDVKPYIMSLQLRSQIPIAKALEQGHVITPESWQKLVNAPDNVTVRDEIRRIKDQPMRKTGVMFILKLNGDLIARDSEHKEHFVGWLDVKSATKDIVLEKCINRIVDNSYIIRERE